MLRNVFKSTCVIAITALSAVAVFGQTTFPGTGVGEIPDGTSNASCRVAGVPLDVSFNVAGIPTAPSNISVTMSFNPAHVWGGDVVATLIAPNGTQFVIFGYTNATTGDFDDGGDGSDLAGPYTFNDSATSDWWAASLAVASEAAIPSGTYRTSQLGGPGASGFVTNLNAAFAGIPTSNGNWILRFTDGCTGDVGSVESASLTLTGTGTGIPFQRANVDLNGDGKSDFLIARAGSSSFAAGASQQKFGGPFRERMRRSLENSRNSASAVTIPIEWWGAYQDTFDTVVTSLGDATTDCLTPADFDGDGADDIAIWNPGAPTEAGFYWIRSSDNTIGSSIFGQFLDDPEVVGDYDGDGIDDPAVFRCPFGTGPDQCFFYFRGSMNNPNGNITYVPWGFGEFMDLLPDTGDFDGDGRNDFCIQYTDPANPGQGKFALLRSSDLGAEFIDWGLSNDIVVPGDYDGDGRSDFCVARSNGVNLQFYILERDGGGTGAAPITWGLPDDDIAPGDYDGDGRQDIAIYRHNASPQNSAFWVLRSNNGQPQVQIFNWGLQNDFAAASWYVH